MHLQLAQKAIESEAMTAIVRADAENFQGQGMIHDHVAHGAGAVATSRRVGKVRVGAEHQ